jgi:hypothetical protein
MLTLFVVELVKSTPAIIIAATAAIASYRATTAARLAVEVAATVAREAAQALATAQAIHAAVVNGKHEPPRSDQ